MKTRRFRKPNAPKYPIGPVLDHLGADVPEGSGWLKMRCFHHDDHQASAAVNHDLGRYVCFTCEFGGNAVDVLAWGLDLKHEEAVAKVEAITRGKDRAVPRKRGAWSRRGLPR